MNTIRTEMATKAQNLDFILSILSDVPGAKGENDYQF
jgi:hypothetical protein